jgi:hypothetical protein
MASNHKLTGVIKGRTVMGTQNQGGTLLVHFQDGSSMTVKTAGSANNAATGGTVAAVRQQGTTLDIDMESGSTWNITMAEPTSSVMVRDQNRTLEYAD